MKDKERKEKRREKRRGGGGKERRGGKKGGDKSPSVGIEPSTFYSHYACLRVLLHVPYIRFHMSIFLD